MKHYIILFVLALAADCAFGQGNEAVATDSLTQNLQEIVVKGERPLGRMKGNIRMFDAATLRERYQPTTAFDMLKHVPQLKIDDETVSLLGAKQTMIVIDGRVSMVDMAQVTERLQAMTSDKVASIDIHLVAPAKYNFNGALVNIRTVEGSDQLTTMAEDRLTQTTKTSNSERLSLMYDRSGLSLFASVNHRYGDSWWKSDYSKADGYRCDTECRLFGNTIRLDAEIGYRFSDTAKLSIDYYGYINDETRKDWRLGDSGADYSLIRSRRSTDEDLHSVGFELELPWKWTASARYKNYSSPYTQLYGVAKAAERPDGLADYDKAEMAVVQTSGQDIDSWRGNINKDFSLGKGANLSVGFTHDYTNTATNVDYGSELSLGRQREWNTALYAQADFTLWNKLNVSLGLRGEKTKQLYNDRQNGKETTVWDELWLFPTVQIAMPLNQKGHTIQLSLQSDKEFPGYWWISPQTTIIDEQSLSMGNPNMRPARDYTLNLSYFAGRNWVFMLGSSYLKDGLAKLPHYDEALGKTVYKGENYDLDLRHYALVQYNKSIGAYNTTARGMGRYAVSKINDYYGADYKSQGWEGYVSWSNDYRLKLNKKGALLMLSADMYYMTPMNNGFTKWSDSWSFDAYARWIPSKQVRIEVGCNNILRLANMRWTEINIPGQEIYESHYNTRSAYVRATITLGKQRQMKQGRNEMDSRYGR